ncbi:nicotinate phosphoribosyltransferase [Geothermobacter hydrogeniphilus]|uniref:Nicotinate phosphoribosyltransferase n=1 Tax=Geothermobacter hydrogeniphilus TaxID=1969733 RepID=A0A1X0XXI3_9BACT|nr:nicotinate phosphoribosyltransferase [Geothermobacter hydrogeniphilus]ORJ57549.1 nicotinate phosphoribosyltransferase [Geothermobacter hydrogeniphilus]
MKPSALLTDLYQLTMLAGYRREGLAERPAVFDLFFRDLPYGGGYAVFAGLGPALDYLAELSFSEDDLGYLASLQLFDEAFLAYLRDFRFRGRVLAPPEGSIVFPHEPLLTVEAGLAEAQLVETALLNIINFQTLVATKAARVSLAAGESTVLEFGLRRAQGPDGALSVARAACIGGVGSTSNVLAGKQFGLPIRGTHAHSWIMAFDDELSAFRAYAEAFPDNCVLLVDTCDTLGSGLPNAIRVAGELRARGHELLGIRLDSGDLAWLSRQARRMLDEAGFPEVRIVASNELDEEVIHAIRDEGGCIDIYGVGTRLATCAGKGGGALGGVYKLVEIDGRPKMKLTADITKATLPGRKILWRLSTAEGRHVQDVLTRPGEKPTAGTTVFDPTNPARTRTLEPDLTIRDLRQTVMNNGQKLLPTEPLARLAERCRTGLLALPSGTLRTTNPHRYKVSISPDLHALRNRLRTAMEHIPGD